MLPRSLPTHFLQDVSFVHVLADQQTEIIFGYCFSGENSGPHALFAAWSPTIEAVSQRLAKLPTLPWMRGHLYLVALDLLKEHPHADVAKFMPNITFAEVSVVTQPEQENLQETDFDTHYWAVLRLCSGLGMIQGRGIAAQHASPPNLDLRNGSSR